MQRDHKRAIELYRRAYDEGDGYAAFGIGMAYEAGHGVPQDWIEAYAWLNLAAAASQEGAAGRRDRLRSYMNAIQIAAAQRRSRHLLEKRSENKSSNTKNRPLASAGTGFFVSRNGYAVTCQHVVAGAKTITVIVAGRPHRAKLISADKASDIAILKCDGTFPALALADYEADLGVDVLTIGFPNPEIQGRAPKVTAGVISSRSGLLDDPRSYQVSAHVNPGNSGGPLFDTRGTVVGIVHMRLSAAEALRREGQIPQGVNYAVKSRFARALLSKLADADLTPVRKNALDRSDTLKLSLPAIALIIARR